MSPAAQEMMKVLTATFKADRHYEVNKWIVSTNYGAEWDVKNLLRMRWWPTSGNEDSRREGGLRDIEVKLKTLGFRLSSTDSMSREFKLYDAFLKAELDRYGDLSLWLFDPEPALTLGGDHGVWAQAKRLSGGFRAR